MLITNTSVWWSYTRARTHGPAGLAFTLSYMCKKIQDTLKEQSVWYSNRATSGLTTLNLRVLALNYKARKFHKSFKASPSSYCIDWYSHTGKLAYFFLRDCNFLAWIVPWLFFKKSTYALYLPAGYIFVNHTNNPHKKLKWRKYFVRQLYCDIAPCDMTLSYLDNLYYLTHKFIEFTSAIVDILPGSFSLLFSCYKGVWVKI